MPLTRIPFKPGIDREGTRFTDGNTWYDCNRIRFRKGRPEKLGGWVKYCADVLKGVPRSLYDWVTSNLAQYIGIGTNLKFYVDKYANYYDITPLRDTTAAGDVTFAAVNGSATITVTDTDHGVIYGDYVTFYDAVSLGGNITADVLNHEYRVSAWVDDDNFEIEATDVFDGTTVLANGSDTGNGGAAAYAEYQINTGSNTWAGTGAWGDGGWGQVPWGGDGVELSFAAQLRLWSQDSFGDDLIFNGRAGNVWYWDESAGTGTRAVALENMGGASNPPTKALQIMVSTLDRHVIAFGCNPLGGSDIDPLLIRWSDQENAVDWTPTSTNSAGGVVLAGGGLIIGAVKTRHEIVIFTNTSIHSMRYVGSPFIYQFSPISENVSLISPNGMTAIGNAVYFMDLKGFYLYEGSIQKIPCSVFDYVYKRIDRGQAFKVFCTNNPDQSEITWFYPAGSAASPINSYVTYNYMEQVWSIGSLERGHWIPANTKQYPVASSADETNVETNYLYYQEYGSDADGEEMGEYIESGTMPIGDGDSFAFVKRVIPDFEFSGETANADITMTIKGSDFPLSTPTSESVSTITASTTQSHVRVRAREITLRLDGNGLGYDWNMGDFRFDMRTDGKR